MKIWPFIVAVAMGSAASAQDIRLTPLVDARLRWESVDQDGLLRGSDAVTARLRTGVAAARGPWQAVVEGESTLKLAGRYNGGVTGRAERPIIADPQNIELSRALLRYQTGGIAITAGRQRVELADSRFVGSGPFRQNDQAFDALRTQWGDPKRAFADVTYAWSNRTINGIQGRGARQQAVSGDNVFALAGMATPAGLVTGYAYLVDQDEAAVQGFRLSSQTYGVRLAGTRKLPGAVGLTYALSWARQSDWHRNPNDYAADYWLAEASATRGIATVTLGHEVLGADDGRALTSVQTPLSSLFKFQGWADKFTTTPPNGLRDLYAGAGLAWRQVAGIGAVGVSATYHRFRSDRLDQRYGTEWDMLATVRRGRTALSARYASYRADALATDTRKFWLQADWVY